jgi:exosortase B
MSYGGAPWLIVCAGFLAMYLPVYWSASKELWHSDDFGHGPIILVIAAWLFWQAREHISRAEYKPAKGLGWLLMVCGLSFYVFGRMFEVSSLEFLSQLLVVTASLLLLQGIRALRVAWFAVFFLFFMVPLPGVLVDSLTGPLKQWISLIVVEVLRSLGLPIARTGVTITIGQYQLLVADACSGLHSIFSLSALGTLFIYTMARPSRAHNVIMLVSIIPIAFFANVIRVIALVLVTYYMGDEAGQGFLHGAAGIILMLVALVVLFAIDTLLKRIGKNKRRHVPQLA